MDTAREHPTTSRLEIVRAAAAEPYGPGAACAVCGATTDLTVVAIGGGTIVCRNASQCMMNEDAGITAIGRAKPPRDGCGTGESHWCGEPHPGGAGFCTEPPHPSGDHIARDPFGKVLRRWAR